MLNEAYVYKDMTTTSTYKTISTILESLLQNQKCLSCTKNRKEFATIIKLLNLSSI